MKKNESVFKNGITNKTKEVREVYTRASTNNVFMDGSDVRKSMEF